MEMNSIMKTLLTYPRACPFCRSVDLKMLELDRDAWAVECLACQAIGPISLTANEATAAWNSHLEFARSQSARS